MRNLANLKHRKILPAPHQACNTCNCLFLHSTIGGEFRDQASMQLLEVSRIFSGSSATSESHALGRETVSWLEWVGACRAATRISRRRCGAASHARLPVWSLSIFDEQARPRCK